MRVMSGMLIGINAKLMSPNEPIKFSPGASIPFGMVSRIRNSVLRSKPNKVI